MMAFDEIFAQVAKLLLKIEIADLASQSPVRLENLGLLRLNNFYVPFPQSVEPDQHSAFNGLVHAFFFFAENGQELVCMVLDLEQAQIRTDLVQRTLRECGAWHHFHPLHRPEIWIAIALRVVNVITSNLTNIDLAVYFGWVDYQIAFLHLMKKAEWLSSVVRNGCGFVVGVRL